MLFSGRSSPFWYRGYYDEPKAGASQIDSTLAKFGVDRIITGHTIIADTISSHYEGKVIDIDLELHEGAGKGEALLIEGKQFYRINEKGEKRLLLRD